MTRATCRLGSTYRMQLNGLGFDRARAAVGYLHSLGVEVLYASPLFAAVPGSTHGYDVADPNRVDPELGGAEGLEGLLQELEDHGMRLLVDVVPNHMAASAANPWWWDVLRRGQMSPHGRFFDIDWSRHGGRVLLPVLAEPLGEALAAGKVEVVDHDGLAEITYGPLRVPVDPESQLGGATGVEDLLERQHYRLGFWRLGNRQGNYRRFFDVDSLVGVRMEDEEVYRSAHRLMFELAADERVAGFRLDHVDGMADPGQYLQRLDRDLAAVRTLPVALVVEKILARDEELVPSWPVDGTTGYEFTDLAGGLFIDRAGAGAIEAAEVALNGGSPSMASGFAGLAARGKHDVLALLFSGQVDRLACLAVAAVESETDHLDASTEDMVHAITAITVHLPVYRTYLAAGKLSTADRCLVRGAAGQAASSLDAEGRRMLDLLCQGVLREHRTPEWTEVAQRWQQLTGAVAAKGVEDTALYRFDGPLAMADVGCDPDRPAVEPSEFHQKMAVRARKHPGSLNATSTHDTKRGEDVRARLAVLTELPDRWMRLVRRWERHGEAVGARGAGRPTAHDRMFIYQTMVGTWPLGAEVGYAERLVEYMIKAAREAKLSTSWLEPDEAYEDSLRSFVVDHLGRDHEGFRSDMSRLVASISPAAVSNSLSAVVLRCTAPGVPDTYQGTEAWAFTLVDPDNRRPVDFEKLNRRLESLAPSGTGEQAREDAKGMLARWEDGCIKTHVTRQLLHLRRDLPMCFDTSRYRPLEVRGPAQGHAVAFARSAGTQSVLTVVSRLVFGLAGPGRFALGPQWWDRTTVALEPGMPTRWRDSLTGGEISARRGTLAVAPVLGTLPVAVLVPAG